MEIDRAKCIHCGQCRRVCIARAIDHGKFTFDEELCSLCSHCLAVCPKGAITHEGMTGSTMSTSVISPESFEDLVKQRRSVRLYREEPIPGELLERLVELLKYSPTGTNTQEVYTTVITEKKKLEWVSDRVMEFFQGTAGLFFNALTLPFFKLFMGRNKAIKLYRYKKHFFTRYDDGEDIMSHGAPALFIFHAPKGSSTPEQDCVIWAANLVLHAETLGLGTCYNGFLVHGINMLGRIKKSLSIARNHRVYATVLAGLPAVEYKRCVVRKPASVNII
jgi:nitroreductase/NAD-dependent dihydropyrimidine dehydrogenase PreA subunit